MKYWNCIKAVLTISLKHKYTRGGTADGDWHLKEKLVDVKFAILK